MKSLKMKKQNGITMIELLLVIAMLALLTGITVSVINPKAQREAAEDGVIEANMVKTCAAIEAYYEGENQSYPDDGGSSNNPLVGTDGTAVSIYLNTWPEGFVYNSNGSDFSIYVQQAGTSNYFKCTSNWAQVRECADTMASDAVQDMSSCDPV